MALYEWFGAMAVLGLFLFAVAPWIRTLPVAAVLLLSGLAAFAVRLHHEGPYPFPRGLDLLFGSASLVVGLLLIATRAALPTRLLLALTPILMFGAVMATLHEAEEVVVLRTFEARRAVHETRLWIVDYEGSPWIATSPSAEHVRTLVANPRVELVRHGVAKCYDARPYGDRETIQAVLARREAKYFAHRVGLAVGLFTREPAELERFAVAIRFDPCPSTTSQSAQGERDVVRPEHAVEMSAG